MQKSKYADAELLMRQALQVLLPPGNPPPIPAPYDRLLAKVIANPKISPRVYEMISMHVAEILVEDTEAMQAKSRRKARTK